MSRKKLPNSPRGIITYFAATQPIALALGGLGLFVAGVAESLGIASLLPLLGQITGRKANLPAPIGDFFDVAYKVLGINPSVDVLLAIMAGLILGQLVVTFCVAVFVGRISSLIAASFRSDIIKAFSGARWSFFVGQPSGASANALANEATRASQGFTALCQVIAGLVQVALLSVTALLISWEATLLALVVGCTNVVWLGWLSRLLRRNNRRRTSLTSSMLSRLANNLNNMKALKAMGVEARARKLLAQDIAAVRRNETINVLLNKAMDSAQEFIRLAALIALLIFLLNFGTQLEHVFVILVLFLRMMQNLARLQKSYRLLVLSEASFEQIHDLIAQADAVAETNGGHVRLSFMRELSLEHVCFAYDAKAVLNDASLQIPAGSLVCLSGPSGAGKTTLLDIASGLIRPQSGEVLVDGVPLSTIDLRSWRQQIGYVPQEIVLFQDTLLANVTLGDPKIPKADVEEALRIAGAWDFVLPEGLEHLVGERGLRLSGGQRQRIAIARALVRKPRLLILDEVTSSLDSATEEEICQSLARLRGRLTILASSHRPALASIADRIYRLEGGRVDMASLHEAKMLLPAFRHG